MECSWKDSLVTKPLASLETHVSYGLGRFCLLVTFTSHVLKMKSLPHTGPVLKVLVSVEGGRQRSPGTKGGCKVILRGCLPAQCPLSQQPPSAEPGPEVRQMQGVKRMQMNHDAYVDEVVPLAHNLH